jgi:nucleoside-diphosphate-sugar epimerase
LPIDSQLTRPSQPFIHEIAAPAALNTSVASWYEHVVVRKAPPPVGETSNWIDVRDLAEAHVRVLEKQEAGGERFIVSAGMCGYQFIQSGADFLFNRYVPLAELD